MEIVTQDGPPPDYDRFRECLTCLHPGRNPDFHTPGELGFDCEFFHVASDAPCEYARSEIEPVSIDGYPSEIKEVPLDLIGEWIHAHRGVLQAIAFWVRKRGGWGGALPQFGFPWKAAVVRYSTSSDVWETLVNPSYKPFKDKGRLRWYEGCYSLHAGQQFRKTRRWKKIEARWYDEDGKLQTKILRHAKSRGRVYMVGRVWQHEVDHLDPSWVDWARDQLDRGGWVTANEYQEKVNYAQTS